MKTVFVPNRTSSMNSLLEDFFGLDVPSVRMNRNEHWMPKANIQELADAWNIELIVPGMEKENFELELKDNTLHIRGKVEKAEVDNTYKFKEYEVHSFERRFNLPKGLVQEDKISASYVNGVLKVGVPKREEARDRGPRTIEIQ